MDKKTFTLSKPILAHGQELSELTIREPDGDDVVELGFPYLIIMGSGDEVGVEIRARIIYGYISKLCGIPLSSAKQLAITDVNALQSVIMSFFGDAMPATSMNTSSLPTT